MVAVMQRYLRTVSEQAERDRKKREEEERILQEMKEERERDHLLLFGTPRRERRASDSDSQVASGAHYLLPHVQTENMMTSHRPFTSFFENPSTTPHLPPIHGIPITHVKCL